MPEGRMLKKRISNSKTVGNLKSDSARLLYTWLIPHLDCKGRYSADPDLIKGHIFPKVKSMTPAKIQKLIIELAEVGLIIHYKASPDISNSKGDNVNNVRSNSETYLELVGFLKYQKIYEGREADSDIPDPKEDNVITHENSCETHKNSPISKVNKSKVKENTSLWTDDFEAFWGLYREPGEHVGNKQDAKDAFFALMRKGVAVSEIAKGTHGYLDFLKHKRLDDNFKQAKKHAATFLRKDRWREFIDFKYEAGL